MMLFSLFMGSLRSSESSISKEQIDQVGDRIISNAEKMYYMGQGSKVSIKLVFPENINNFSIWHKNKSFDILVVNYTMDKRTLLNYYYSDDKNVKFNFSDANKVVSKGNYTYFNESSYYESGPKKLRFISEKNKVDICFVNSNSSMC